MSEYQVKAKFTADTADFKKGVDDVSGASEKIPGKFDGIGSAAKRVGKVIAGAFAVKEIIAFGKGAAETAAELNAMKAQFEQVFQGEDNAKALERINAVSQDTVIHTDRLTNAFSSFGAQTKGAGMDASQSLEATEKATRLAADSAAFYDTSLEQAQGSIASFMKGNFSAGDAIGVFTNAKKMDVKANEMYGRSWVDLSEAEQQWLLLDTVEKTYEMNGAIGQAVRESGELANVQGNLTATWDSFKATIGEPILENILIPAMQGLMSIIEKLQPVVEGLAEKLGEGLGKLGELIQPAVEAIKGALKAIIDFIQTHFLSEFEGTFDGVQDIIGKVSEFFKSTLIPAFKSVVDWVMQFLPPIKDKAAEIFGDMAELIKTAMDAISKVVQFVLDAVKGFWDKWGGDIINTVKNFATVVMENIQMAMDVIQNIIKTITSIIKGDWEGAWEGIKNILSGVLDIISNTISSQFEHFKNLISRVWEEVKTQTAETWDNIKQAISDALDRAKEAISNGLDQALSTVKDFVSKFIAAGGDIVRGIAEGITDGIAWVVDAARNVAKKALNKMKSVLGIHSPSKVMSEEVGEMIAAGTAEGIDKGQPYIDKSFENMLNHILSHKDNFVELWDYAGYEIVDVFDNMAAGGERAISELIGTMQSMTDAGLSLEQMASAFGDSWNENINEIVWEMSHWDSETQKQIYNLEDMQQAYAKMHSRATKSIGGVTEDISKLNDAVQDAVDAQQNLGKHTAETLKEGNDYFMRSVQNMVSHILDNKDKFTQAWNDAGYEVEGMFESMAEGGKKAADEVIGALLSFQDGGFTMSELAEIFGSSWDEAIQSIIWNMAQWDSENQTFMDNIGEMGVRLMGLRGVASEAMGGIQADMEAMNAQAKLMTENNVQIIMRMLDSMKGFITDNKDRFIEACSEMGYYAEDVYFNIAYGGESAAGVIAQLIDKLMTMEDETKRASLAAGMFGGTWHEEYAKLLNTAGTWEDEYNIGSWSLDQNKMLADSLVEVQKMAEQAKEAILATDMPEAEKSPVVEKVKSELETEIERMKTMTMEVLKGIRENFNVMFTDIKNDLASVFKDHIIPNLQQAMFQMTELSREMTQIIFDDFDHTFYELGDVVYVHFNSYILPKLREGLNNMVDTITSMNPAFQSAGQGLMESMASGIRAGAAKVKAELDKVKALKAQADSLAVSTKQVIETVTNEGSKASSVGGQAANINLSMGNSTYRAYVGDITNQQDKTANLQLRYGG